MLSVAGLLARLGIRSGISGSGHHELLEESAAVRLVQQREVERPKATGPDKSMYIYIYVT